MSSRQSRLGPLEKGSRRRSNLGRTTNRRRRLLLGELQADPGGAGGVVLVKVKWLLVGKNHTEVSGIRGQDDFCGRII